MREWTPSSWQERPAAQQPQLSGRGGARPRARGAAAPAAAGDLVGDRGAEELSSPTPQAGKRFLLQGGDCAESFDDCDSGVIANKLKILLQMSLVLVHGARRRVIRVGRFAGQYAKPRSEDEETRAGARLPAYRGDLVNRRRSRPRTAAPTPSSCCAATSARR